MAGLCAALAAARLGLQVALVHDRPVLGGNASSEVRVFPHGAARQNPWADETGIINELLVEDRRVNHDRLNCMWDLVLYDAAMREPNLSLHLNTTVRSARLATAERIEAAVADQLGSERTLAFCAPLFVDASGDGALAAAAGAAYRQGREAQSEFGESLAPLQADEHTMGSSLLLVSRDLGRPVPFDPPPWIERFPSEDSLFHRNHSHYEFGFWWVQIGGLYHDPIRDNEEIRHELLRYLLGVWDHIKNQGDHGAQNHALEWFGTVPGKRESRRFLGDHILTENDLRQRRLFEDRVAYGGWFLDAHHTLGGMQSRHLPPEPRAVDPDWLEQYGLRPYSIPYRSLYSRDIRNLFFAGRNISATHVAFGSTRLIKTGAVMGQAVGTAAYLCRKLGCDPRELYPAHIGQLQQLLLRHDCYLPALRNLDEADLARTATARASSEAPLTFPPGDEWVELDWPCAQLFPVSAERLEAVELRLRSTLARPATLRLALRPAPDVWTFEDAAPIARATATLAPHYEGWLRFALGAATEPGRLYWLEVDACPGVHWSYARNRRQSPMATTAARRRPESNYWRLYERGDTTGCFALRTDPVQRPYGPANVLSGVARPEQWTNIWISDPAAGLPQDLELHWDAPVTLGCVQLTFDTNVNLHAHQIPPLTRVGECVRDYELHYLSAGEWRLVVAVTGNYQRLRVHRFRRISTQALRLRVLATNGAPSARVYEIRAYDEGALM